MPDKHLISVIVTVLLLLSIIEMLTVIFALNRTSFFLICYSQLFKDLDSINLDNQCEIS